MRLMNNKGSCDTQYECENFLRGEPIINPNIIYYDFFGVHAQDVAKWPMGGQKFIILQSCML